MATHTIVNKLDEKVLFNAAISSNGANTAQVLDTAHFDGGLMFSVAATAYTDGTYAVTVEESEDNSTFTTVPAAKVINPLPSITAVTNNNNSLDKFGIFSNQRYVRVTITASGVTSGATILLTGVQMAENQPVS